MKKFLSLGLLTAGIVSFSFVLCKKNKHNSTGEIIFDSIPIVKILNPLIREVSGIADSKTNSGFLWAHEDSGNPPQIYLISHEGIVSKSVYLEGIFNRDWEEIALFDNNIYIADIGDNGRVYSSYKFYKFSEPTQVTDTIRQIETINFIYPDGPHDAEAFCIDPFTRDIFVFTKRDVPSRIYKLSYPYGSMNTLTQMGSLPYAGVVSAAISNMGNEIMIKTYGEIYYYSRQRGASISSSLEKQPKRIGYIAEPQGEAISFASNGSGFYTLSEQSWATTVRLYFYKRH